MVRLVTAVPGVPRVGSRTVARDVPPGSPGPSGDGAPQEPVPGADGAPPGRASRAERLAPLRAAAGLVLVEGILCALFGVVEMVSHHAGGVLVGLTGGFFFVAYGVGLGACAWGMHTLRPWSRSPVLLSQLLLIGLAWNVRTASPGVAAGALVLAVVVLAGVLHPRSIDALNREEHRRR